MSVLRGVLVRNPRSPLLSQVAADRAAFHAEALHAHRAALDAYDAHFDANAEQIKQELRAACADWFVPPIPATHSLLTVSSCMEGRRVCQAVFDGHLL